MAFSQMPSLPEVSALYLLRLDLVTPCPKTWKSSLTWGPQTSVPNHTGLGALLRTSVNSSKLHLHSRNYPGGMRGVSPSFLPPKHGNRAFGNLYLGLTPSGWNLSQIFSSPLVAFLPLSPNNSLPVKYTPLQGDHHLCPQPETVLRLTCVDLQRGWKRGKSSAACWHTRSILQENRAPLTYEPNASEFGRFERLEAEWYHNEAFGFGIWAT